MKTLFVGKNPGFISFCKSHSHTCWEIIIPTFGNGYTDTDFGKISFSPGSLYIMPPGVKHSSYSESTFSDIYVHVDFLPFDTDKITQIKHFKNLPHLGELIYDLYIKNEQSISKTQDSAVEFIVNICRDEYAEPYRNITAKKIRDYLTKSFAGKDITMQSLEHKFQYNQDYIRRLFKAEYGKTPLEYVDELRLINAKELLENMPMYSITQISELCGFGDPLYFSVFFKKHTGISPKHYRKNTKN